MELNKPQVARPAIATVNPDLLEKIEKGQGTGPEQFAVLSFDICSSTEILETLLKRNDIDRWRGLLIQIKNFLRKSQSDYAFKMYNFTGDGWILLFRDPLNGRRIMKLLDQLCLRYQYEYGELIEPVLETKPKLTGLTIGMDWGDLVKVRMNGRDEYIGRPLNFACRLQSAIKQDDKHPEYKVLMSKSFYERIKADVGSKGFVKVRRTLHNVAGDQEIECIKKVILRTPENYQPTLSSSH